MMVRGAQLATLVARVAQLAMLVALSAKMIWIVAWMVGVVPMVPAACPVHPFKVKVSRAVGSFHQNSKRAVRMIRIATMIIQCCQMHRALVSHSVYQTTSVVRAAPAV